jgi:hypothetical protein
MVLACTQDQLPLSMIDDLARQRDLTKSVSYAFADFCADPIESPIKRESGPVIPV